VNKYYLVCGDFHIDDKDERFIPISKFLDKVDQKKPDVLVLNGDIGDPWKAKWKNILKSKTWLRLKETCKQRNLLGLTTVWVAVNHDSNAKQEYLPGTQLCKKYDDGNLMFRHGWEFDLIWGGFYKVIGNFLFWWADRFPNSLVFLYNLHTNRPFKGKTLSDKKHDYVGDWSTNVGIMHLRAREYAKKHNSKICVNHSHCPTEFDGLLADSGDFEDSFSWVEIQDNTWELYFLDI